MARTDPWLASITRILAEDELCGLFLIICGSVILYAIESIHIFSKEFVTNIDTVPGIIIILGFVIASISIFGCVGARYNNAKLLIIYVILMSLAFLVHLFLITFFCVKEDAFLQLAAQFVDEVWEHNDESMNAMDALQMAQFIHISQSLQFKCCGVHDYKDYISRLQKVPFTCCNLDIEMCATEGYKNVPGCLDVFLDYWNTKLHVILYSSLGIAGVQMGCIIIGVVTVYKLIND
uniref:Tetraspanin n=1 Tax=Glossina palpalis gambiensis TaxID=67801 RepID=A0A1B0BQU4_9MUSC